MAAAAMPCRHEGPTGGVGVTALQKAQMNLRPASTNCMKGFMYALHSPHLTGPASPKSTTCRAQALQLKYGGQVLRIIQPGCTPPGAGLWEHVLIAFSKPRRVFSRPSGGTKLHSLVLRGPAYLPPPNGAKHSPSH